MRTHSLAAAVVAAALFVATSSPQAQTPTTWTGSVSPDWFNPGNWNPIEPSSGTAVTISTAPPTEINAPGAQANFVTVGGSGVLTIQNGGTLTDFTTSQGTNVTGSGVLTIQTGGILTTRTLGVSGSGVVTIQNGGTVNAGFPSIGESGTLTVTGQGSTLNVPVGGITVGNTTGTGTSTFRIANGGTVNDQGTVSVGNPAGSLGTVIVTGPGSVLTAGSFGAGISGTGTLTVADGGTVDLRGNANIAQNAGSQGAITVTGPGSSFNVNVPATSSLNNLRIGLGGTGTLTIADGGTVRALGSSVQIAVSAGSSGTLNIGAAPGAPAAPGTLATPTVGFGPGAGTINFNHTSANYTFAPQIVSLTSLSTGAIFPGTVDVLAGTTIFTANNTYLGLTTISGNTAVLAAGSVNVFSPNSGYLVENGGTLALRGFDQTLNNGLTNAGTVATGGAPGPTAPGTTLTVNNYVGAGGTLALNTFLGGDNSPSDKLVINGGMATGSSVLHITNTGGPGAEITSNGIQVVQTTNNGTTASGAFTLGNGELRAGAFDYFLFHGGVNGSDPNDWFLRSSFSPPGPPGPPVPPFPPAPPPESLPPGVFPIIGPELATYGVVQPIARQLGLTTLGTLHERMGDTLEEPCTAATPGVIVPKAPVAPNCTTGIWGRVFGQQINDRFSAFADPRASGQLVGLQTGFDFWRGSLIPGHRDTAGFYFAYGNSHVDVDGLITNPEATAFVLGHTGTVNLNGYSLGGYWTHYGPTDWYVDTVVQGTFYEGNATTEFASLPLHGAGVITRDGLSDPAAVVRAALRARAAGPDHLAAGLLRPGQ